MLGGDVVVAHALELTEVELAEAVAGDRLEPVRRRDRPRGLERARERARVDGRESWSRSALADRGRPAQARRGERDVEAPVAAALHGLVRLGVADEQEARRAAPLRKGDHV